MELAAIREALWWTIGNTENCSVMIYSDSQYAVNCINVWYKHWLDNGKINKKKNISLIEKIIKISNGQICKFEWIKGHNKNKFNNMAD